MRLPEVVRAVFASMAAGFIERLADVIKAESARACTNSRARDVGMQLANCLFDTESEYPVIDAKVVHQQGRHS
ncbi:MAG: hypothetical protein KDB14_28345 [Planctomycetales bacterium]|nr:hypothetical protein [Planctomycetales bacterium]